MLQHEVIDSMALLCPKGRGALSKADVRPPVSTIVHFRAVTNIKPHAGSYTQWLAPEVAKTFFKLKNLPRQYLENPDI